MSDIRVFVSFAQPGGAFFAGETLECNIVFKNVSTETTPSAASVSTPGVPRLASRVPPSPLTNGNVFNDQRRPRTQGGGHPSTTPQLNAERPGSARQAPGNTLPPMTPSRSQMLSSHKPAQSLTGPPSIRTSPLPPPSPFTPLTAPPPALDGLSKKGHRHKRSISIISIGADPQEQQQGGGEGKSGSLSAPRNSHPPPPVTRPRHGRSASLQFSPRPRASANPNGHLGPPSATWPNKNLGSQPSTPVIRESVEPINSFQFPARRPSIASSGPSTPAMTPATPITPGGGGGKGLDGFKFPAIQTQPDVLGAPQDKRKTPSPDSLTPTLGRKVTNIDLQSHIEDSESEIAGPSSTSIAAFRGLNGANDTPRSSGEFYSFANSTTDTLASEYDPRGGGGGVMPKLLQRGKHVRRHSLLSVTTARNPETLMMGYAQVSGSFVLDGSLMQTSVFDEVKRKGVLGGQRGGGVVGIESKKSEGGWGFGGWGLGLGVSGISSILGGNNMSTIAEMKTIASSKSIPILSTPQSVLFVDLRLAPGESRTYSYKFPLPETLPPSHRGKAIKITYNLVIGTQRPGKGVQHPKTVEIPFRVYPFVRSDGCLFSHDLMSPIIKLRDTSSTKCLDEQPLLRTPKKPTPAANSIEPTMSEFLTYIDSLLGPRTSTPNTLLSPSSTFHNPLPTPIRSTIEEELTPKEAIEAAILGSIKGFSNSNQFEIRRNQRRVASLTLARPAYKLGETVTAVLDFSNAEIKCYHLHVSLESAETVSSSLALRSESSIHRATRRIHAHYSISTLFSSRATIALTIPPTASPDFTTSGVSCVWTLRLEFITPASMGSLSGGRTEKEELLDLTYADGRGDIFEAKQVLHVESFDASIPVKVFPNPNECGWVGGQPSSAGYVV